MGYNHKRTIPLKWKVKGKKEFSKKLSKIYTCIKVNTKGTEIIHFWHPQKEKW